ncbi:hypothetical protein D9619_000460 [Psilocybe cf. subviscida]|uniref:Uncharacterized protein n=1 Tax=Psilocybe cf. subviscida TaxID=2480587 RepID=A0A8H5BEH1_9AGAR|nr:hypothetical protein D9619_000460 [Psilocybe cf. subviscida]
MANGNTNETGERRRTPIACRHCRQNKQKVSTRAIRVIHASCEPQLDVFFANTSVCARCVKRGKPNECVYVPVAQDNGEFGYGPGAGAEDQQGCYGQMMAHHSSNQAPSAVAFQNTFIDASGRPVTGPVQSASSSSSPPPAGGAYNGMPAAHGYAPGQQVSGTTFHGAVAGGSTVYPGGGYHHPPQHPQSNGPYQQMPQMGVHQPQHPSYSNPNSNQYGVAQENAASLNWAYANVNAPGVSLYAPYPNGQDDERHPGYSYTNYSYPRQA